MGAESDLEGKGLVVCTPTSRHGSSNIVNNKIGGPVKSIQPVFMDKGPTPVSVLSVGMAVRAPVVSSSTMTQTVMKTPTEVFMSITPTIIGDNQHRVACDSEGQRNLSQVSAPCINDSRTATRTYRIRDFRQLPSGVEAGEAHNSCKYVNIEQRDENRTPCRGGIYHKVVRPPVEAGKLPNWSRVVKPEVISLDLQESWPLLKPSTRKEEPFKTLRGIDTIVNAESHCENLLAYSSCKIDDQFRPNTKPLQGSREVMLDEHCWPSLEKFNKQSVMRRDDGVGKKRAPLQHTNISTNQDQRRVAHRGIYKAQNMHLPPILLMVNKDFIVTSPLKENLLLTLALMGRHPMANAPEDLHAQTQILEGTETKRQVLVGQFKAFSSFLHFMLGQDATRVRTESNAGGTSTISECLSVEYFVRRFQARDIVTEMEVEYCSFNWKKVDYICTLYGQRVGISVTRAMSFPDPKDFSAQMAYRLLHKKLFGLVVARHGVSKRHSFSQCILHVWCETQQTADLMQREYDAVSRELDIADDVVMVLTVADGYHARPIFYESLLRNGLK